MTPSHTKCFTRPLAQPSILSAFPSSCYNFPLPYLPSPSRCPIIAPSNQASRVLGPNTKSKERTHSSLIIPLPPSFQFPLFLFLSSPLHLPCPTQLSRLLFRTYVPTYLPKALKTPTRQLIPRQKTEDEREVCMYKT